MHDTVTTETGQERPDAAAALRWQIQRLRDRDREPSDPQTLPDALGLAPGEGIDLRPASAYEAVTRQMVDALNEDLRDIKARLNNLFFMLAGAILIDILSRLLAP